MANDNMSCTATGAQREVALRVLEQCLSERSQDSRHQIVDVSSADITKHIRNKLAVPGPAPRPLDELLASAGTIFKHRVRMDHPRFFGFIPSPASDASWMGDMLTSACNPHAGSWLQSSGPSAVEMQLLEWMATDLVGFPNTAGGCFVSGGSMANLTALALARDQKLSYEDRIRATIYVSEQTHSSIAKGLKILGFHQDQIRKVACDPCFRIDVSELQNTISADRENGKLPFLIVGSCGTTNTGAIDPLSILADVAEREGMWLHVDGAYGASALLCKSRRPLFQGLERCDSLSWDAHKWLFQTYGCGMVLVRDRKLLNSSFGVSAEYVQDAAEQEDLPNFWNYGIELTRPARAMRLWFSLQLEGLDKIESKIEHGFKLAEVAETTLKSLSDWQVLSPASMAIICFRCQPAQVDVGALDRLNQKISQAAIEKNLAAPLTTRLNGVLVLRICCIHPDLTESEMVQIIGGLDNIAKSLTTEFSSIRD